MPLLSLMFNSGNNFYIIIFNIYTITLATVNNKAYNIVFHDIRIHVSVDLLIIINLCSFRTVKARQLLTGVYS